MKEIRPAKTVEELSLQLNHAVSLLTHLIQKTTTEKKEVFRDWITEDQAKEVLDIQTTALWKLRKERKIEWSKPYGKVYYSLPSIIKYLEESARKSKF